MNAEWTRVNEAAPGAVAVIPLTIPTLNDREAIAAALDAVEGERVLFATPDALSFDALDALRIHVRLAHERSLFAWARLGEPALGFGDCDLAAPAAGCDTRRLARALRQQLPEIDGVFLDARGEAPAVRFPNLSRAFFDEFANRTGFSGQKYRLEDRLAELTDASANPRVRLDFAQTCEDLAFRLLSNFTTECEESFDEAFAVSLHAGLPRSLLPQPFVWQPDPLRFARLGALVFGEVNRPFERALVQSLAKFASRGVFIASPLAWQRAAPRKATVAVIVNWRAALASCEVDAFAADQQTVARTLDDNGVAFDLLTPEQMTTSEMTESGGFRRAGHDYAGVVYPWATVHAPYEWRELNGYLEEGGRAAFIGAEPCWLTDGTRIEDKDKQRFRAAAFADDSLAGVLVGWLPSSNSADSVSTAVEVPAVDEGRPSDPDNEIPAVSPSHPLPPSPSHDVD